MKCYNISNNFYLKNQGLVFIYASIICFFQQKKIFLVLKIFLESTLWSFHSIRLRLALMLALALIVQGLMRSNLNMAMVCMVNRTAINQMIIDRENNQSLTNNNYMKIDENETKLQIDLNECNRQQSSITTRQQPQYVYIYENKFTFLLLLFAEW